MLICHYSKVVRNLQDYKLLSRTVFLLNSSKVDCFLLIPSMDKPSPNGRHCEQREGGKIAASTYDPILTVVTMRNARSSWLWGGAVIVLSAHLNSEINTGQEA